MPGSCRSGFRSRPSIAGGIRRLNGLDVNSRNSRKPAAIQLITASTRATIGTASWRLKNVTATIHTVSSSTHSSNEPSWPPHTAAKR